MTTRALIVLLITVGIFIILSIASWIYIRIKAKMNKNKRQEKLEKADEEDLKRQASNARRAAEAGQYSE